MKLKLILSLIIVFTLKFSFAIDLIGVVKDGDTGEPLPYATVSFIDKNVGVITDENGNFRLEIKKANNKDTLQISYLGYKVLKKTTKEISITPECLLTPYAFEIAEVEIKPLEVENILRQTYDRFYENHVHKNLVTKGYYREQLFDNNKCVRFGEAVFDTRFSVVDGEDVSKLEPHLARSIEDSTFLKNFNSIFNKKRMMIPFGIDNYFDNGVAESVNVKQFHEFLGKIFFDKKNDGFLLDYKLNQNYKLNGRENYYIEFTVEKKGVKFANGHLLIDNDNYGIAAFEIEFNEDEDLTKILIPARFRLIMRLLGFQINIVDFEAKLNNKYSNGKWLPGNGIQILQGDIAKSGNWFKAKMANEFHSFHSPKYKAVKKKDAKFEDIRVNNFDSDFWGNYPFSPIQPKQQQYIEGIKTANAQFSGEVLSNKVKKKIAKKKKKEAAKK